MGCSELLEVVEGDCFASARNDALSVIGTKGNLRLCRVGNQTLTRSRLPG